MTLLAAAGCNGLEILVAAPKTDDSSSNGSPGGNSGGGGGGNTGPTVTGDVTVNSSVTYQTMKGWEVLLSGLLELTPSTGKVDLTLNNQLGPTIISKLVNELGINRVRLEARSGFENTTTAFHDFTTGAVDYNTMKVHFYEKINDNGNANAANLSGFQFDTFDFSVDAMLLPIKAAVEANGEQLYINFNYVDFINANPQGPLHHATSPDEYAEFIHVFFDHLNTKYAANNIIPDAVEIVLEPDNTAEWNGTRIGQAIVATGNRLNAAGYSPEFIGPSVMNASSAVTFWNDMTAVPGALGFLSMLSYHRYIPGNYQAIWNAANASGVATGMLEFDVANVDDLIQDLTVANASAWQKYAIVRDSRNNSSRDYAYLDADVPNSLIKFSPNTAPMMPYFKYIRAGAVRVDAPSTRSEIHPVAFRNTNGTYVVVVKADSAATFTIGGLPNATYKLKSMSFAGQMTSGGPVTPASGLLTVTVPQGTTAIYDVLTPGPNLNHP